MTHYVAFLRGILPTNPNMRNEKLREVFERLGFSNVQTVISSGNVLFESPSTDVKILETRIEKSLTEDLGLKSAVIIRSQEELEALIKKNLFKNFEDTPTSRLNVTFLKNTSDTKLTFPYSPEDGSYQLLSLHDQAVCSVIDLSGSKTPALMSWLEKEFGKQITTRTWKTVHRILAKWDSHVIPSRLYQHGQVKKGIQ